MIQDKRAEPVPTGTALPEIYPRGAAGRCKPLLRRKLRWLKANRSEGQTGGFVPRHEPRSRAVKVAETRPPTHCGLRPLFATAETTLAPRATLRQSSMERSAGPRAGRSSISPDSDSAAKADFVGFREGRPRSLIPNSRSVLSHNARRQRGRSKTDCTDQRSYHQGGPQLVFHGPLLLKLYAEVGSLFQRRVRGELRLPGALARFRATLYRFLGSGTLVCSRVRVAHCFCQHPV